MFTPAERAKAATRTEALHAGTYAKRFAAKEACSKALGTGFQRGVHHSDLGVVNAPGGRPTMVLTGAALLRLHALAPPGTTPVLHLTMTDEYPYAFAQVLIEARAA